MPTTPGMFDGLSPSLPIKPGAGVEPLLETPPYASDEDILALWETCRKEDLEGGKAFDNQWRRNIYYVLGRQWLEYIAGRGWRDKPMAPWIPRPVTNKCKETVQAIRAMFTSIKLGVNVRPNGSEAKNVSAAATADELAPLLYESHHMNSVMSEFDFWLCVTGNAFIHTFMDYDMKYGRTEIPSEQCQGCGAVYESTELVEGCPDCAGTEFAPALDELGEPIVRFQVKGQPTTLVLSPLELAFSNSYPRFADLPRVTRKRWRTKAYFEANPALAPLVESIAWEKTPTDTNLGLFQSLAQHNDLGISNNYANAGGNSVEEGISEYEVWNKPTETYPEGLVYRIYGEKNPIVAHLEDEALPGPLPYKDADGSPLFTFAHAAYDHVGGRILGSGPLDAIIQKQDQLNQLDSMILLIIQRMSNPVWLTPKGAEIQKFTGMPGLVLRWNPLTVGGNAKPERIAGEGPHQSLFTIRVQYLTDIEELAGTFDILKGAKPAGVDSFAGMNLLVERSQSRFASVFMARGDMFTQWYKFAIELERAFGPDDRTMAVLTPNKKWTFKNFKRANLQGSMSVVVEDGASQPKTPLGMRAAIQHAHELGLLNTQDPDQQYEGLRVMGILKMVPTLDIHVQRALQKQQEFEEWVKDPAKVQAFVQGAMQAQVQYQQGIDAASQDASMQTPIPQAPSMLEGSPFKWKGWYNPIIHKQELIKWANSDVLPQLMTVQPMAEQLVEAHLAEIEAKIAEIQMAQAAMAAGPQQQKPGGASKAMGNSNQNAGKSNEPKGQGEGEQNAGPR